MSKDTAFIGLDTHKKTIAVAIATDGREGEVRYFGEIANDPAAVDKLVRRLSDGKGGEAGPGGTEAYPETARPDAQRSHVGGRQNRPPDDRRSDERR